MDSSIDFRLWNGTIPALTFCYHNRIDEKRADILINRLWNIDRSNEDYSTYLDYVKMVANASISSLKLFSRFANDKRFKFADMFFIAKEVHPVVNAIVSAFDPKLNPKIVQVMTEKGVCYAVNAVVEESLLSTKWIYLNFNIMIFLFSIEFISSIKAITKDKKTSNKEPISCSYAISQCFMKLEVFDPTIQYFVHSPFEIVTEASPFLEIGATDEIENTFNVLETM